jgi:hypothetical protein
LEAEQITFIDHQCVVNRQRNTDTRQSNFDTETLIDARNVIGLDINVEKNKYTRILLSRQQTTGQNHNMRTANSLKMCHSSNIWEQQYKIKI